MSKLLTCKIDVTKIDKSLLFKGKKGTYMDVLIWLNDKPDQYGNDCSIEQKVKMGEKKNYIGNGKFYQPRTEQVIDPNDQAPQSDLPFN